MDFALTRTLHLCYVGDMAGGEREPNGGSDPGLALNSNRAVVQLHEGLHDGESQSEASVFGNMAVRRLHAV